MKYFIITLSLAIIFTAIFFVVSIIRREFFSNKMSDGLEKSDSLEASDELEKGSNSDSNKKT